MRLVDSIDEDDRNALIHMINTMLAKQPMNGLVVGKESSSNKANFYFRKIETCKPRA
jgi:hypothetical protein